METWSFRTVVFVFTQKGKGREKESKGKGKEEKREKRREERREKRGERREERGERREEREERREKREETRLRRASRLIEGTNLAILVRRYDLTHDSQPDHHQNVHYSTVKSDDEPIQSK